MLTVDGHVWRVHRAWPREGRPTGVDLEGAAGKHLVGTYWGDPDLAAREARRTPGACRGDDPRLVVLPGGADRRLPRLAAAVAAGGVLVAHRPGRRGVVRTSRGTYLKVVRAGRGRTLAERHAQLASLLVGVATVPAVVAAHTDAVELTALPGDPPGAWWTRDGGAVERTAALLRRLGSAPVAGLPVHDAAAEVGLTRTWVRRAVTAGWLPERDLGPALHDLELGRPGRLVAAHRDLHDGQLLLTRRGLGVLDPDTLAAAEPELDTANLLTHLRLRVDQGELGARAAQRTIAALDAALVGSVADRDRLEAHVRACQLRLAAVYAFRPPWRALARRWYEEVTGPAGTASRGHDVPDGGGWAGRVAGGAR